MRTNLVLPARSEISFLLSFRLCARPQLQAAPPADRQGGAAQHPCLIAASFSPKLETVCGPSGVGKSTLIARLRAEFPDDFGFSVSHTTRQPRPGEENGVHYYFADKAAMEAEIAAGKFVESANVHGNLYGTSFDAVRRVSESGRICILDIDVQGVASCRRVQFEVGKYVFVAPPELSVLESRLRGRRE
jgi:guanylate kinase